MKPKNFPQRKNQRRIASLARLTKQPVYNAAAHRQAVDNTSALIVDDARNVRTKKARRPAGV